MAAELAGTKRASAPIKFSSHAQARMDQRGILLSPGELARLEDVVARMQDKGVKEAMVYLLSGTALIVSVKNRLVITVVDSASIREYIFTNIDSAAII